MNDTCHWPYSTLLVLSDQTVVCGCTDPLKTRVLGHLDLQTVAEVWNGPRIQAVRNFLREGRVHAYCRDCFLYSTPTDAGCNLNMNSVEDGPAILQIEPCVRCNLRCPSPHCDLNNEGGTRNLDMLSFEDFKRIFDQVKSSIQLLRMYNYGDPFLNPDTTRMIAYARQQRPDIYIDTHTNGLPLNTDAKRRAFVESGLDYVIFSIDGFFQNTYERYRKRGNIKTVLNNIKEIIRIRNDLGLRTPNICWRYILFDWNDSDEEMTQSINYASAIGIDRFAWHLNSDDQSWSSKRFTPGAEGYERIKHAIWDVNGVYADAIPRPRPACHPTPLYDSVDFQADTTSMTASPSQVVKVPLTALNTGTTSWRAGKGLPGNVRLAAIIMTSPGNEVVAELRAPTLPADVDPGETYTTDFRMTAPANPGEYLVQIDMVNEFHSWFAAQDSRPLTLPLSVEAL